MPDAGPVQEPPGEESHQPAAAPGPLAPVWHTIVLIAGILALSVTGASRYGGLRPGGLHGGPNRLMTYGTTAVLELLMLGWVVLGMRLKKILLRTILGDMTCRLRPIARDLGIAVVFWFGALMILGSVGLCWSNADAIFNRRHQIHTGSPLAPSPSQKQTLRTLERIAPANGEEIAGWVALCLLVGFVEESVFRGYLQNQFTAWTHGSNAAGVVFSALIFGAAHGYQGVRNMVLLAVFGALFSLLALSRKSLRPCMFAHSWHDIVTGLALGLLRSHHVL